MQARDLLLAPQLSGEQIAGFLIRFGFRDTQAADRNLQQICTILGDPERLANSLESLLEAIADSVDPDACIRNLETFFSSVPNPRNLLFLLETNPIALELLTEVLGASPYLAQSLSRNPEYFYWLVDQKHFQKVCDQAYFQEEAAAAVRPFDQTPSALDALKRLLRREKLRIAAQDLSHQYDLEQVTNQISWLVEAILEETFRILAREMLPSKKGFCILALGKLGGGELNFSSDIDLLYLYDREDEGERMLRFAREYTRALGNFTDEGRLFRVDLRLRPMGRAGEIAYPLNATRSFFQTWADTTDRLALIKCRPIAGDLQLGAEFLESLQSFIFKKYLDFAALEEIRWIKRKIDRELRRAGRTRQNIKLGLGGIREIEFFAQSLQILHGGQNPEIRTPNTLDALRRLLDGGFIELEVFQQLSGAYRFLRDLEHKLQLVQDRQIHSLPRDGEELLYCARRMGYRRFRETSEEEAIADFKRDLNRHLGSVQTLFASLLNPDGPQNKLQEILLNIPLDKEKLIFYLVAGKSRFAEGVADGIELLLEATAYPYSPARMRNLLANLIPSLLPCCRLMEDPRLFFSRLDRFCERLGSRVPLLAELLENPEFRERLSKVFLSGEFMSETLIQNPELVDAVAAPERALSESAELDLPRGQWSGFEGREHLRLYKKREEFKIALGFLLEPARRGTRAALSRLAERCVRFALGRALKARPALSQKRFAILALGKLGGGEMTFHSDLDLVFLLDDRTAQQPLSEFQVFLHNLRDELQAYTEAGKAYQVDFRLRPEGKQGNPVVSLALLKEYFQVRAEPWERLAWVKARCLQDHGCPLPLSELIFGAPFSATELDSLQHVRQRKEKELSGENSGRFYNLKIGRGSLFEIQFLVQTLQIQYQIADSNTLSALKKLESVKRLHRALFRELQEALLFFYRLESMQGLLNPLQPDLLSTEPSKNDLTAYFLGFSDGDALLEKYQNTTHRVRAIYEQVFEALY